MKEPEGARTKVPLERIKMQKNVNEASDLEKKIMTLEISKRKLMGEGLDSCSLDELQQLEHQLEKGLANVKARMNEMLVECIEKQKEKERVLLLENAQLKEKVNAKPLSNVYLPAELWPGILCRLPVKSLVRFRCVSTSWLSLIGDAEFARLHLKSFKNNCDETHLLVVQGKQRNCVVKCSDTFETYSETPPVTLGQRCGGCNNRSWDFVCSLDGLALLKRFCTTRLEEDLKVWNPSIRKLHEFPSLPEINITSPPPPKRARGGVILGNEIGLGYDPLANDYKHVKLISLDYKTLHLVAIYSLGAGSWKMIPFRGKGSSCSKWHWDWDSVRRNVKVYLRGSLHFIATDVDDHHAWELVSFDLSSEVFSSINMPELPDIGFQDFAGWNKLVLIDGGCSLAVFDTSVGVSLWVLESEPMCWTKRYTFYPRFGLYQFWYVKKNGHVLTQQPRHETFTDETGEISVKWDEVISYNPQTYQEYKVVQGRGTSLYPITQVSAYVESLILLK